MAATSPSALGVRFACHVREGTAQPKPISMHSIQLAISEVAAARQNDAHCCHSDSMRHTFVLKLLERKPEKLVELAALLGHESLDTAAAYLRPS